MNRLQAFTLLFIFLFFGCRPEREATLPSSTIELNFAVNYGGQPVIFGQNGFDYQNLKLLFEEFSFFFSDAVLIGENGSDETDLFSIQLADFSDVDNIDKANFGKVFFAKRIPVGNYSGIRFDIGVPADLNSSSFKQDRYFGTHPLNNENFHSSANESYIFMKMKGEVDADADGSFDDQAFNYQTTKQAGLSSGISFSEPISIEATSNTKIRIELDLKKILGGDTNPINILTNPETTPANMSALGATLMSNLKGAISQK